MVSKLYIYLPIIFCLILFFVFQSPSLIKTIIGYTLILVLSLLSSFILIKRRLKKQWAISLQMIIFVLAGLCFFVFLSNFIWQIIFILFFAGILSFFLFHTFQFFYQPRLCQPRALEKMGSWLNFIISYWVLVGLGVSLGADPLGGLFLLSLALVFVLFFWLGHYTSFVKGDDFKSIKTDLLIISLVLTEFYLVINFLPLGVYFNALIVSLLYSIIIKLHYSYSKNRI